jgi:Tol biopolymer transport system component
MSPLSVRQRLAAALVLCALMGLALVPGPAAAQDPDRPGGRIAVPRGTTLWGVQAASGAEQAITTGPDNSIVLDAALTADGSRAVFARLTLPARGDPGGSDLYLAPASGGEATLFREHDQPGATLTTPIWTPDGASVLYTYTPYVLGVPGPEAQPRIERIGVNGGSPTVVVSEATAPGPSADGRLLSYLRSTNRGDALWLANADGSDAREIIPATRFLGLAYPRISPDGSQIAIAATIDLPAPPGPAAPRNPFAWRPGAAAHGLPWDIWLVNVDGSNLRRLTFMVEDDPSLAWSPDGRWLAIQGGYGLTLVEAGGTRTERISRKEAFGAIDWARE